MGNLPANKITSGELDAARIPNLDASKITGGTLNDARLPTIPDGKIPSSITRDSEISDWAKASNTDDVPFDRLGERNGELDITIPAGDTTDKVITQTEWDSTFFLKTNESTITREFFVIAVPNNIGRIGIILNRSTNVEVRVMTAHRYGTNGAGRAGGSINTVIYCPPGASRAFVCTRNK